MTGERVYWTAIDDVDEVPDDFITIQERIPVRFQSEGTVGNITRTTNAMWEEMDRLLQREFRRTIREELYWTSPLMGWEPPVPEELRVAPGL